MMHAIIQTSFQGIDNLQIAQLTNPQLQPFSVLIKTQYTPVLPWDLLMVQGQLQSINPIQLPHIVGYSFAGRVQQTGALRNHSLIEKNVIGVQPSGSNATLINSRIPPLLFEIPEELDLKSATTIIGGADAALMAIQQSRIQAKDVVLLIGASGGVGTYLIQLLKMRRAIVIGVVRPENYSLVKDLGADYILDYTRDLKQQLLDVPVPHKIIDAVGSTNLLNEITSSLSNVAIFSLSLLHYSPLKITHSFHFSNHRIKLQDYRLLLQMLKVQKLQAVIQDTIPYYSFYQAYRMFKNKPSHGRILLRYND